jgi:hypothetical protein
MNDPAVNCRVSTGNNILFFPCHSGLDPESRELLLDSCFRRNDVLMKFSTFYETIKVEDFNSFINKMELHAAQAPALRERHLNFRHFSGLSGLGE